MFVHNKHILLLLMASFFSITTIQSEELTFDEIAQTTREPHKKLTFLCYIAADNDLAPFADRNLEQMAVVGSNENINIIVHLDIRKKGDTAFRGRSKITKRLIIRKGHIEQVGKTTCMDSGLAETVIDAATWAITDFPSDDLIIDFWNHGSGCLNPSAGRIINPAELFCYDHKSNLIVLDRSIGFIDYVNKTVNNNELNRGICFDETTGHYLDDVKLTRALQTITQRRGKKIDLIIFDACLMAATEVACLVAPYCKYMTASEEVELGTGYDYTKVLSAAANHYTNARDFAYHIVDAYKSTYNNITHDYTQSAIDLSQYNNLNDAVNSLAEAFLIALPYDINHQIVNIVKRSRNLLYCTHFDEPSYIDLDHFCSNILENIANNEKTLQKNTQQYPHILTIKKQAQLCKQCIKNIVINNVCGKNLAQAAGLSIYFPNGYLHSSYPETIFGQQNIWCEFIATFIRLF